MTSTLKKLPPLYKRTATGAVQEWKINVEANTDGSATIVVVQGQVDGKKQEYRDTIREGKNVGRKNETTALQQACMEAEAEWRKKQDRKHYGLSVDESAGKRDAAPMLAKPYDKQVKTIDWANAYMQPKFDGHRCIATLDDDGDVLLHSRTGVPITAAPHIQEALKSAMKPGDTFDGELYVHGMPLNKIASLIKRQQEGSKKLELRVYDVVMAAAFIDRFKVLLQRPFKRISRDGVNLAETVRVASEMDLMRYQAKCIDEGYEGAMLRWGEFGYESGKRSSGLLKVKSFMDAEFVIVGAKEGRGTFEGIAVFVCETQAGDRFDVTAPGTMEDKRAAWTNRMQFIGRKMTVKFQFFTKTDTPVPFLPVAIGIRD